MSSDFGSRDPEDKAVHEEQSIGAFWEGVKRERDKYDAELDRGDDMRDEQKEELLRQKIKFDYDMSDQTLWRKISSGTLTQEDCTSALKKMEAIRKAVEDYDNKNREAKTSPTYHYCCHGYCHSKALPSSRYCREHSFKSDNRDE
jgi:hypothetical protein